MWPISLINYHAIYTDDSGRYAYDQQPKMCHWNLRKLAEALAPGGLTEDMIKEGLKMYIYINYIYLYGCISDECMTIVLDIN